MVASFCFGPFIICQCQSWSQSVSFASAPLPLRCPCCCVLLLLLLLFAFCQNGNEENLHGRCICGIFPSGRRVRRDGRGRLGVRMSFLIISVFAFFAFALFLLHLCTLSPPLLSSLSLTPSVFLSLSVPRLSFVLHFYAYFKKSCASPARVLRSFVACNHLKCDNFLHSYPTLVLVLFV